MEEDSALIFRYDKFLKTNVNREVFDRLWLSFTFFVVVVVVIIVATLTFPRVTHSINITELPSSKLVFPFPSISGETFLVFNRDNKRNKKKTLRTNEKENLSTIFRQTYYTQFFFISTPLLS